MKASTKFNERLLKKIVGGSIKGGDAARVIRNITPTESTNLFVSVLQ